MGELFKVYPVTMTRDLPQHLQSFEGSAAECWEWLREFGREFDHVGELQYVLHGLNQEAYPYFEPNLYSISARYDTTFKPYSGATLAFVMHPAGGRDHLPEKASKWAESRRYRLQHPPKKYTGRLLWD